MTTLQESEEVMELNISAAPDNVRHAFDLVRAEFPTVIGVKYFRADDFEQWLFFDADGDGPDFKGKIDVSALEEALDAVVDSYKLPVTFLLEGGVE